MCIRDSGGPAAEVFRAIANRIVTDIAPPADPDAIDMAGCSARDYSEAVTPVTVTRP